MRKRKSVAGNTLSPAVVQVNAKIVTYGTKKIEDLLGIKKEEKKEEKKAPAEKPEAEHPEVRAEQPAAEAPAEEAAEEAEKKMGIRKLE
jgi:hypothetical protein